MRKTIGKLNCLVRPGEEDDTAVVILHGFGADASDLAPLAEVLDPDERWNFYFPDGPLEVPIGPMMSGRAWFPIALRDLEAGIDFTQIRPPGLDNSSNLVYDLIFNLNVQRVVIGGFSQGAMVSTEVALENPNDVAGLMLLSCALLDEKNWRVKAAELKGKPLFQSHGLSDPVIPFRAGQQLFEILKAGGAQGGLMSFAGGHEIPVPVLMRAKEFLNSTFG